MDQVLLRIWSTITGALSIIWRSTLNDFKKNHKMLQKCQTRLINVKNAQKKWSKTLKTINVIVQNSELIQTISWHLNIKIAGKSQQNQIHTIKNRQKGTKNCPKIYKNEQIIAKFYPKTQKGFKKNLRKIVSKVVHIGMSCQPTRTDFKL